MSESGSSKGAPPRESGWGRATASLRNVQFRRVFVGNMAFFLAMGGQGIVRPWIAYQLTDQAFALGITAAAMAIPMFFLSPIGGALADRVERRRLIVLAQSIALVSELTVFALLVSGNLEFWHLVAAAASLGCCFPLVMPARSAIVANLVERKHLGAAMGLNMTGVNVTRVLGPAAAGYLISVIGVEGAYLVNVSLYAAAIAAMLTVNKLPPLGGNLPKLTTHMIEGFQYLRKDRLVGILLLFGLVPQFLAMPFQNILPAFTEKVWEVGPAGFGMLNAAVGVGAVVGSVYVAGRSQEKRRLPMMMAAVMAFGALLAAFAMSPYFWPALVLAFLANIGASVFSTLNNVSIQLVIPDEVRGRVSSYMMMSVSLPLLGALPIGWIADQAGPPAAVAGASLLAVVMAVGFYASSALLRGLDDRVRSELRRS